MGTNREPNRGMTKREAEALLAKVGRLRTAALAADRAYLNAVAPAVYALSTRSHLSRSEIAKALDVTPARVSHWKKIGEAMDARDATYEEIAPVYKKGAAELSASLATERLERALARAAMDERDRS